MVAGLGIANLVASALQTVQEVGVAGALDILIIAVVIYTGLLWLRRSQSTKVAQGILITGVLYIGARFFDLALTTAVLEAFFAVATLGVIIIFRNEIRRLIERLAQLNPRGRFSSKKQTLSGPQGAETIVRTLADLARDHIGALVVIKRRDPLHIDLNGGVQLNGELSEPLLKSLFDPNSVGHDGAVVIEGGLVTRFACHLPLSSNFEALGNMGTRHAAALGLAERTDALCIVVSEESGKFSVASNSTLQTVAGPDELLLLLQSANYEAPPAAQSSRSLWRKDYRSKAVALGISVLLWLVLVHGGKQVIRRFTVPVEFVDLPAGAEVIAVSPKHVVLTLAGPRRSFFFLTERSARLALSLADLPVTRALRKIHTSEVFFPRELTLREIRPSKVRVTAKLAQTDKPKGDTKADTKANGKGGAK